MCRSNYVESLRASVCPGHPRTSHQVASGHYVIYVPTPTMPRPSLSYPRACCSLAGIASYPVVLSVHLQYASAYQGASLQSINYALSSYRGICDSCSLSCIVHEYLFMFVTVFVVVRLRRGHIKRRAKGGTLVLWKGSRCVSARFKHYLSFLVQC
ncbi:hypothetical protein F4777DRAFT_547085 [Nemania sp. FL0916]|nr:hypothetical protein F4777DRAFT_547085 [Nemania sp. FL0916]